MNNQPPENSPTISQPLPPGPTSPPWDQAKAWIERPTEFWIECHQKYGDTFTIQFGTLGSTVLFCEPDAIRQIFALSADSYECHTFNDHYRVIMGSQSLLTLDGDEHWDQRRAVTPTFQAAQAGHWIEASRSHVNRLIQDLSINQIVHVRRLAHDAAFNTMLGVIFHDQQPGIKKLLQHIFFDYMVSDYGTWSPWAKFVKSHAILRTALGAEIRRLRERDTNSPDPLNHSLFNRLVHYQNSEGVSLSELQIEDHVFTMLIAGVDTSAIATTWAIYWIHEHPHVQERLRNELQDINGVEEHLQREDHFLHAVCLESLRMYPVVTTPSGRKLLQPTEIEGRSYPSGTILLPCTYLAHRREQIFPRPQQFSPERFENRTYMNWEFFPFGGGRRVCIGARMAVQTMKSILFEMLTNLELLSATEGEVEPIRHGTLLAPSDNFQLKVAKRLG